MLNVTIDFSGTANRAGLPGASITDPERGFGNLLSTIFSGIMAGAALLAFLYLIWGAVEWISSGGDKSKLESARNKITQALVGLIVLAGTTALFMLLQQFLDICVLRLGTSC